MSTIMKCIICYSRLDFTAHYLCGFSYTEFPWASSGFVLMQVWAKPVLWFVYSHIHLHVFNHLVCVFFWAALPCHPLGCGSLFQWKLDVKTRIQMWISPPLQHSQGCQCPRTQRAWPARGRLCAHMDTCEESPACCRSPAEAALPAGLIRSAVLVPVPCLELCD